MNKVNYIVGAVLVLAILAGGYFFLKGKAANQAANSTTNVMVITTTPVPSETPTLTPTPTASVTPTSININITVVSPTPAATLRPKSSSGPTGSY